MKQILVVITEKCNSNVEVFSFANKEDAREFIKTKYIQLIQSVDYYDYKNSYISKKFELAQVSSYSNVYRINMCSNITEVSKNRKR